LGREAGQLLCVFQVDPFPDEDDWYTREREIHPLQGGPEPKRRFTPSKWEEKKCACCEALSALDSVRSHLA
jgi:hypothetical protein